MAETVKDGGPAFAKPGRANSVGEKVEDAQIGMSLRDWFAGQALAGLCANTHAWEEVSQSEFARRSYEHADAMLQARTEGRS